MDLTVDEILSLIRYQARGIAETAFGVASPGEDDIRELRKAIRRLDELAEYWCQDVRSLGYAELAAVAAPA